MSPRANPEPFAAAAPPAPAGTPARFPNIAAKSMPVLNDPAPRIKDGGDGGSISPELSSALRFFEGFDAPPTASPPSPLSSLPKPNPKVAPSPPLPAPRPKPPTPRNRPANPPSSGDPNPPPPESRSLTAALPAPTALHHLLECMAAPFSLNGPAPQSTHVIVLGSRKGSTHFFAEPPSLPPGPLSFLPATLCVAARRDAARSAAAAALSVTALGVTPSSPRALPLANTHHRLMCMRMPLVLNGPPRHASQ
mmetsp:Transcript_8522/g.35645  ORF Transcript_8522/g.35645 Transcript_8522/m.35645 type:complete len:251 (-) Transcript_8522:837-1589(-)